MTDRLWRYCGWALVTAAIVVQCLIQHDFGALRFGFFNGDKVCQVTCARSLLDGQGIAMRLPNEDDLSEPRLEHIYLWPVGYSFLAAAGLRLVDNPVRVVQAIDYATIVVFFLTWLAILEVLGRNLSAGTKLVFWAVWAAVTCPLIPMTSNDMLSMTLYYLALLAGLLAVKGERPIAWALGAAVAAAAAASVRYSYWPLLAAVPAGLGAVALLRARRPRLFAAAVACALLSATLLGSLVVYQRTSLGRSTYIVERYAGRQGLYWERLQNVHPFPASMVGFPDIWGALLEVWPEWRPTPMFPLGWKVSAGVLAALALGGLYYGLTRRTRQDPPPEPVWYAFLFLGAATTLLTLALLVGLTLVTPGDPAAMFPGGYWTFLLEDRYFAPFAPFVTLALAGVLRGLWSSAHRGAIAFKLLAVSLLLGWLALGLSARYLVLAKTAPVQRPVRKASLRDLETAWHFVRRHLDEGRNVVFVRHDTIAPEDSTGELFLTTGAMMAGAAIVTPDVVRRPLAPRKNPVVIMTWAPTSESGVRGTLGDEIRRQGDFLEIAGLWRGTLWEARVEPAQTFTPLGVRP